MVSGNELYAASEIFGMLQNQMMVIRHNLQVDNDLVGGGGGGGEPQCDINGYCKGDTCLGFSALEGENPGSLDSYYSTIDSENKGEPKSVSSSDDYREKKKTSFDSDYERMMQERGQMGVNGNPGGGPPPNVNFSR